MSSRIVKTCDRCGKDYSPLDCSLRDMNNFITNPQDVHLTYDCYKNYPIKEVYPTQYFDLCPDCAKQLFKWLYNVEVEI